MIAFISWFQYRYVYNESLCDIIDVFSAYIARRNFPVCTAAVRTRTDPAKQQSGPFRFNLIDPFSIHHGRTMSLTQ